MTTDPFDIVREALENVGHVSGSTEGSYYVERKALAALDSIRDRYLPLELLPDGYLFDIIQFAPDKYQKSPDENYRVEITDPLQVEGGVWTGTGKTPNAAFLSAVKAIGGGE